MKTVRVHARRHSLSAKAVLAGLVVCGVLLTQGRTPTAQERGFTFALIGDLGYFPREEPWLDNVLAELNKNSSLAFVVYVGDLSSPRYGCTDDLLVRRHTQFNASAHPFIYTPGDNEWTDCHPPSVKNGDPLQRLARVRQVFFSNDKSLGKRTIALTHQSANPPFAKYRENVRWDHGGVTFVTLNIPGSNNGIGRSPDGDAEFAERNKANLAWLREGFQHAKSTNSRAIMLLQQANIFPRFPPFPGDPKKANGFVEIRELLEKEATAFRKPVVLVHGDSHYFRIDNPYRKKRVRGKPGTPSLENFLRLETFGSPNHHWVQAVVEPDDPNVFTFRPRIVKANLWKR